MSKRSGLAVAVAAASIVFGGAVVAKYALKTSAAKYAIKTVDGGLLSVQPAGGGSSSGNEGGPFTPTQHVWTLTNTGQGPLNWTASVNQNWITLSAAGGSLAAGFSIDLTATIDSDANALGDGSYSATVTITNTTNGQGSTTRQIALTVNEPPPSNMQTYVEKDGIRWDFNTLFQVGQYVNGDWWVYVPSGTLTVTSVTPGPTGSGTSFRNGSMKNPVGDNKQAFDGRSIYYNASVGVTFPLVLSPGDSLLSTESRPNNDPPRKDVLGINKDIGRTQLWRASVLTVVGSVPTATAFRPPYAGTSKPTYDAANINWGLLPSITFASGSFGNAGSDPLEAGETRWQQYARYFNRPWIWTVSDSGSEAVAPLENSIGYYQYVHRILSEAMLLCCCADNTRPELVRALIQLGIDEHYAGLTYTGSVQSDRRGSKSPILLAAKLLGVSAMETMAPNMTFKTDTKTYIGVGWSGARALWRMTDKPGAADPYDNYEEARYDAPPSGGCRPWCKSYVDGSCPPHGAAKYKAESYRRTTHSWTWVGEALAARKLGLKTLWNHDPFFDYADRWMLRTDDTGHSNANDDVEYTTMRAFCNNNPCGDGVNYGIGYPQGSVPVGTWVNNMWALHR